MEVAPQLEVVDVRNVVVDAPERLDGGDGVDLLQVGFVFCEGRVVHGFVDPRRRQRTNFDL